MDECRQNLHIKYAFNAPSCKYMQQYNILAVINTWFRALNQQVTVITKWLFNPLKMILSIWEVNGVCFKTVFQKCSCSPMNKLNHEDPLLPLPPFCFSTIPMTCANCLPDPYKQIELLFSRRSNRTCSSESDERSRPLKFACF